MCSSSRSNLVLSLEQGLSAFRFLLLSHLYQTKLKVPQKHVYILYVVLEDFQRLNPLSKSAQISCGGRWKARKRAPFPQLITWTNVLGGKNPKSSPGIAKRQYSILSGCCSKKVLSRRMAFASAPSSGLIKNSIIFLPHCSGFLRAFRYNSSKWTIITVNKRRTPIVECLASPRRVYVSE